MALRIAEENDVTLKFGTGFGKDHEDVHSDDDTLEVSLTRGGGLLFEINEPWSGDSESGFGRQQSTSLSKEQARHLMMWLRRTLTNSD